ncbi:MAG TPA: hypothetical protein VMV33_17260 [Rhodocyclaceae bacterium]|nr:hypothetical protein [Rhodocyclaceae bacterium]
MAENSSHGPGMGNDFAGTRQHQHMATGKGPVSGGNFGIGKLPGTANIPAPAGDGGRMLSDGERSAKPSGGGGRRMGECGDVDHGKMR